MEIKTVAEETGKSMAQVAINWVACHGCIPLVGCRSVKQAKDTLGSLGWSLTEEQVRRLDSVALGHSTLDGKKWRRTFFATLFGCVMINCRAQRAIQGSAHYGS